MDGLVEVHSEGTTRSLVYRMSLRDIAQLLSRRCPEELGKTEAAWLHIFQQIVGSNEQDFSIYRRRFRKPRLHDSAIR